MSQAYCKLRPVVQWPFSLLECNCCDRISTGQVENLAWAWYSPVHFSTCAKYSQPKNGPEHQAKSVLLSTVTKEGRVVAAVKRFFKQPKIKIKSKQISGWNVGSVQGDQGSICTSMQLRRDWCPGLSLRDSQMGAGLHPGPFSAVGCW